MIGLPLIRSLAVRLGLSILLATSILPPTALGSHGIPHLLDEVEIKDEGGYAAWRLDARSTDGGTAPDLHLHLGHHRYPNVTEANHTYLGLWFVDLDHGYVDTALVATIEHGIIEAHAEIATPRLLEASLNPEEDWSEPNGGFLPLPSGEWLVLAFWVTDGTIEADLALGTQTENGDPLIELEEAAYGGADTVFAYDNGGFDGAINVQAALDPSTACTGRVCMTDGADARYVVDASRERGIDDRLFGLFSIPGQTVDASWKGPQGSDRGSSRAYWFHGAPPGGYAFDVHENKDVGSPREPLVALGADVDLPVPTTP